MARWPPPYAHTWTPDPHSLAPPQHTAVAALLPPDAYRRLLRHERTSGELYHILGLEPASAARLAAQLLLPRLPQLPPAGAERLLRFVAGEWEAMKVCVGEGAEGESTRGRMYEF